jgi:methyl-accepting chemotaxis protein
MAKKSIMSRMSIKLNLLLPLGGIFLFGFSLFIIVITTNQSGRTIADFEQMMANNSELIATTNITNLWNVDQVATEQNLKSFLKNKEIIKIEIRDDKGNTFKAIGKELKGDLVSRKQDILRDGQKLGEAHIWFTNYYILEARDSVIALFLLMGSVLFVLMIGGFFFITNYVTAPIGHLTGMAMKVAAGETGAAVRLEKTRSREVAALSGALEQMTEELKRRAERFQAANDVLKEIILKAKDIVVNLNSSSREIESAAQEQTSGTNEYASGITEVSATLEELTITAQQITKNVGELVFASEESIKSLTTNEGRLLQTVSHLTDVGAISRKNAQEIGELGKRSALINEMVELIKEVANKTNILSINASIEASRSGEAGSGFAVVAAEIRELSKETIASAKNVEKAAREIRDFISSIIVSTEYESAKVVESGNTVKSICENLGAVSGKIGNNYSFTQKIDVSIKQQESGSRQAADTMRQMAEISRQSAGTARQILEAVKEIVALSSGLDATIAKVKTEESEPAVKNP